MTHEIARFFDTSGYYKSRQLVPDNLITRMREVVEDHLARAVPPIRLNERGEPSRLDHLIDRDSVFLEALRTEAVIGPLKEILGPTVDVVRHRHNHATRNITGDIPFRLHRDIQQWSQPLVAVFIYLDDSTIANGCTTVVPGTHRAPYAGPQSGGGGGNWADEHEEYREFIGQELPIEIPRGGVLFLNCLCFHSVGRHSQTLPVTTRYSTVFACRATDELTATDSHDAIRLYGEKRYLANDVLRISGSLRQGDLDLGASRG